MILSFPLCCEHDLMQLMLWGALSLISVSSLLCPAKIAGPHRYGLTTTCRAALRNAHCKLPFWQLLAGSWSDFPQFCLHLTSTPSSAASLCCLKWMRCEPSPPQLQEHELLAKQIAVSVPWQSNCCHRAVVAVWWPQKEQKHHGWRGPKEASCWVPPLRAVQRSPILLLQDRLCPKAPRWGRSDSRRLLKVRENCTSLCGLQGEENTLILNSTEQQVLRLWVCFVQPD